MQNGKSTPAARKQLNLSSSMRLSDAEEEITNVEKEERSDDDDGEEGEENVNDEDDEDEDVCLVCGMGWLGQVSDENDYGEEEESSPLRNMPERRVENWGNEDEDLTRLCAGIQSTVNGKAIGEDSITADAVGLHNLLILCDGCDAHFHLFCVGLTAVPSDDWFCKRCRDF